jgi:hypothetical protein
MRIKYGIISAPVKSLRKESSVYEGWVQANKQRTYSGVIRLKREDAIHDLHFMAEYIAERGELPVLQPSELKSYRPGTSPVETTVELPTGAYNE